MSSIKENIANKSFAAKPGVKIGIAQSLYNPKITDALKKSCLETLLAAGVEEHNIFFHSVPGAFELPLACQRLALEQKVDAAIALGAVVRGETPHFDYVAGECARALMDLSLKLNKPVIFGVLTVDSFEQAQDRIAGGKAGDKGVEAAQAALMMTQ